METKEQFLERLSDFSNDSKVWIYQADKKLSDSEVNKIGEYLRPFVDSWAHHGMKLKADFGVLYNLFIIFVVDESHAEVGGCGIDSSVHLVQKICSEMDLEFFDRLAVAFFNNENNVECYFKNKFAKFVNTNDFNRNTLVFNNQVKTLEGIKNNWIIPFNESWQNNFFSKSDSFNLSL